METSPIFDPIIIIKNSIHCHECHVQSSDIFISCGPSCGCIIDDNSWVKCEEMKVSEEKGATWFPQLSHTELVSPSAVWKWLFLKHRNMEHLVSLPVQVTQTLFSEQSVKQNSLGTLLTFQARVPTMLDYKQSIWYAVPNALAMT